MINYLKGTLVSKVEEGPSGCFLTVEVNNIGYLLHTNKRVAISLPPEGEEVKIYTSLIHKEDVMYLCGFNSREDRDLFNILQGVSGVGSKVSLLLLSEFSAPELISTVIREDHKALSRTKGVGPKLAQRMVLELKDKLVNWRGKEDKVPVAAGKSEEVASGHSYREAESVLLSLGYSKDEIENSLQTSFKNASDKNNSEELLRLALQWLSNN